MRVLLSLALVIVLTACGTSKSVESVPAEQKPVETLYSEAAATMESGNYVLASKAFEEVERLYPYSKWATQAQLMSAYSSYEAQRYDDAILSLDRFIELHPGNKDVPYAHYLKALSFYEQISDVSRDQFMTEQAMKNLNTVIKLYPESKYARDASLKRDLTLDHLAGKEMDIGRYYLNRGHINAALSRFRNVIKEYQTTTHVAEALHRLVEGYLTLGIKDEAARVAAVLGHNYPGNKWYDRSYKLLDDKTRAEINADRGFVDRTVESLFKPD